MVLGAGALPSSPPLCGHATWKWMPSPLVRGSAGHGDTHTGGLRTRSRCKYSSSWVFPGQAGQPQHSAGQGKPGESPGQEHTHARGAHAVQSGPPLLAQHGSWPPCSSPGTSGEVWSHRPGSASANGCLEQAACQVPALQHIRVLVSLVTSQKLGPKVNTGDSAPQTEDPWIYQQ